jgi:hypothetical protein
MIVPLFSNKYDSTVDDQPHSHGHVHIHETSRVKTYIKG